MKIVVLMSTYNGEKYLREQIDSILAQEGCVISLIVRDDGSKDGTTQILQEYEDAGRLSWYTGDNLGPGLSFWDLLMRCGDADYYAFSDQDDIWDLDKLLIASRHICNDTKPMLYCSNTRLISADGTDMGGMTDRWTEPVIKKLHCLLTSLCYGGIPGCTMVLNRAFAQIIQRNGIPRKMILHDMFLRALCHSIGGEIIFDGRAHMGYRQHGNNVVGVQTSLLGKLRSRMKMVFRSKNIHVDDHAKEILRLYAADIPRENLYTIYRVANYRKNVFTRISLACSTQLREVYFKPGFWLRLALFLGNK